jgi:hypothetical protein
MERATLLCPEASLDSHTLERLCLPFPSAQVEPLPADVDWERLDEPERIRQALIRTQGKVVAAARLLGLSRSACVTACGGMAPDALRTSRLTSLTLALSRRERVSVWFPRPTGERLRGRGRELQGCRTH